VNAAAKRRLFNPLRSLKRWFGHRGKRLDTDVTPVRLTASVTSSSNDAASGSEHSDEPARSEIEIYFVVCCIHTVSQKNCANVIFTVILVNIGRFS